MDYSREVSEAWKVWIAGGGIALLLLGRRLRPAWSRGLLVLLVVLAGLNYFRMGPKVPFQRVDTYDFIHYYLNARYFDELGYFDLYPACILADHEAFGPFYPEGNVYLAQDDTGHHLKPISHALERGRWVKEHAFTPERWAAFSTDFLYLQRSEKGLNAELWQQLIQDHGFNGTVGWTVLARPFSLIPVTYVKLLGWIDVLLLGVGTAGLVWAYGGATAAWVWFWLFLTYSTRWPTLTWAFFRYDYVTALMLGMAFLKRGRPFWAGVVTGWATVLRMFPVTWLFGLAVKAADVLVRERKLWKPGLLVLGGCLAAAGVIQGAGMLEFGESAVVTHFENMENHQLSENLSSRRIGLALALPFRGALLPKNLPASTKEVIEAQKPLRYGISIVTMLVLGWGLRRKDPDEAYAFGFVPFFLLTTASYYYYVVRITLVVLHASRLDRARHRVGLAALVGIELFTNWAETTYPGHRVFLIGWLASLIFAYILVQAIWLVWEARFTPPARDPAG